MGMVSSFFHLLPFPDLNRNEIDAVILIQDFANIKQIAAQCQELRGAMETSQRGVAAGSGKELSRIQDEVWIEEQLDCPLKADIFR